MDLIGSKEIGLKEIGHQLQITFYFTGIFNLKRKLFRLKSVLFKLWPHRIWRRPLFNFEVFASDEKKKILFPATIVRILAGRQNLIEERSTKIFSRRFLPTVLSVRYTSRHLILELQTNFRFLGTTILTIVGLHLKLTLDSKVWSRCLNRICCWFYKIDFKSLLIKLLCS